MTITPGNGDLAAGIAGSYTETIAASPDPLVTGDVPALFTTDELVAASQTMVAGEVVGFSSGALIPAESGVTAAIGILVADVTTGGGDTTVRAAVWRGGVFNPDLLTWDASFSTDELRKQAFEGAPAPTAIVIRKPATMTV